MLVNPSTYVELSLTICLYSVILSIILCLSLSFSNTSALVEYPVLVFLITGNSSFSNNIFS